MKYFSHLIAMLLPSCGLCIASCSADSTTDPEGEGSAEMVFDVAGESRAAATSIEEFTVYGDMKHQTSTEDPQLVFDKTKVEKVSGKWVYAGSQFWMPYHEHSFVAVSPSTVLEAEGASPRYVGSKLTFSYSLPTYDGREMQGAQDKTEFGDLVIATHRRHFSPLDDEYTITFTFEHLLSVINFTATFDDKSLKKDADLIFYKVELTDFRSKATYAVTPAPRMSNKLTDDRLIEIADYEGNDNMTIVFPEPKVVKNGASIDLFDKGDAIMMLPQSFAATSEAKARFTYSFSDDLDDIRQGTIALKGVEWNRGKSYVYHFTIDKVGLNFGTATIESWSPVSENVPWKVE